MTTLPDASARVVVVGGGLAGGRTCAALRAAGHTGELVLVGEEQHRPYDRPPLSKAVLTDGADPDLGIDLDDLGVKARLGVRATGLDRVARVLHTDAGDEGYDVLVLATGAQPVRLPGDGPQVCLRTLEDARRLREALLPGARVVLVGAGWIGAEVATAALAAGCQVTCLEGGEAPLAVPLGAEVGRRFLPWWGGVDLRTAVRVTEVARDGVRLAGGELVPADVVVTGIGVRADLSWIEAAGLATTAGGVAVDHRMRTEDPSIFAVGDVAARHSPALAAVIHSGHWDEAANGPAVVAAEVAGGEALTDQVPYFWSDQFGRKVQYVGQHRATDTVVVREHPDPANEKWGVAWISPEGRLTGHLSIGLPRAMVQARAAIADRRRVDPAALSDITTVP